MPFSLASEESCVAHKEQRKRNKIVHNAFMTPTMAQRRAEHICVHIAVIKRSIKSVCEIFSMCLCEADKISIYLFRAISIFSLLFFLASSSSSIHLYSSSFCRKYVYMATCAHTNIELRVRENHTWLLVINKIIKWKIYKNIKWLLSVLVCLKIFPSSRFS